MHIGLQYDVLKYTKIEYGATTDGNGTWMRRSDLELTIKERRDDNPAAADTVGVHELQQYFT